MLLDWDPPVQRKGNDSYIITVSGPKNSCDWAFTCSNQGPPCGIRTTILDEREWQGTQVDRKPMHLPEPGSRKKLELQSQMAPEIWNVRAISIRMKSKLIGRVSEQLKFPWKTLSWDLRSYPYALRYWVGEEGKPRKSSFGTFRNTLAKLLANTLWRKILWYLHAKSLFSVYNSYIKFYSGLLLVFEPERKMLY